MATLNRPRKFQGTEAERKANRATHYYVDGRCVDCDCKHWHETANYPCGQPVPRETVELPEYPPDDQPFDEADAGKFPGTGARSV